MEHVFYILAIFPLIYELWILTDINKAHKFLTDFKHDIKGNGDKYSYGQILLTFFTGMYIIWNIIGFFSSQWLLFVVLFSLGMIPKNHKWYNWIDSLVSIIILIFIILNKYHLHINILNL